MVEVKNKFTNYICMKFCMHEVKRSVYFGLGSSWIDQLCWEESMASSFTKKRFREAESVEHTMENLKKSTPRSTMYKNGWNIAPEQMMLSSNTFNNCSVNICFKLK